MLDEHAIGQCPELVSAQRLLLPINVPRADEWQMAPSVLTRFCNGMFVSPCGVVLY